MPISPRRPARGRSSRSCSARRRARRAFGWVAEADIDGESAVIPAMMRRRARIGALTLIVGTGGTFEIWDAELALERGDADLRELAAYHLDSRQAA